MELEAKHEESEVWRHEAETKANKLQMKLEGIEKVRVKGSDVQGMSF